MENLIKVGYFRQVNNGTGAVRYVSYREFNDYSEELRLQYRERLESGAYSYYCSCRKEDVLPLTITSNGVIRVASNKNQNEHRESCPKSVFYSRWVADTQDKAVKGISLLETENSDKMLFNISLPQLVKSTSSSSSSASTGNGSPREKRTSLLEFVISLNKIAWEKQTFSKKKEIKIANKEGKEQTWEYKDLDAFNRLVYGVSNDILVKVQGTILPFQKLYYHVDAYYKNLDYRRQWFIYALVDRVGDFKESRKYQYLTLRMPCDRSKEKTPIRVRTEDFKELFPEGSLPSGNFVLAGYVVRKYFKAQNGEVSDWMELTKGVLLRVNNYGLYAESERVADAADVLSDAHVLFKRPYMTLENYANKIPTFEIEIKNGKNLLIDYAADEKDYTLRCNLGSNNEEYACICIEPSEDDTKYLDDCIERFGRKE